MKFVICHTITVILPTLGSKGEIVVKNTESGFNVFGDLFPVQRTHPLRASAATGVLQMLFLWSFYDF